MFSSNVSSWERLESVSIYLGWKKIDQILRPPPPDVLVIDKSTDCFSSIQFTSTRDKGETAQAGEAGTSECWLNWRIKSQITPSGDSQSSNITLHSKIAELQRSYFNFCLVHSTPIWVIPQKLLVLLHGVKHPLIFSSLKNVTNISQSPITSSNCFFFPKQNQKSPKPKNSRTGSKSSQMLQILKIMEPAHVWICATPTIKKICWITDKKNN